MTAVRLPSLYAIVDVALCTATGRPPLEVAAAYLRGGVTLLQLRAKDVSGAELLRLADAVRVLATPHGATVVVNDRIDVACAAGTGVHLGQHDLPPAVARRLLGGGVLIGVSTHSAAELALAVQAPVDYVAMGPVYATTTKANPDPVVGLAGVRAAAHTAHAAGLPLVAIGGISLATAPDVLAAGADSVAVIGDLLTGGAGPEAQARAFLSIARA